MTKFFADVFSRSISQLQFEKLIILIQNKIHKNKQIDSQSEKEQIFLMSQKYVFFASVLFRFHQKLVEFMAMLFIVR